MMKAILNKDTKFTWNDGSEDVIEAGNIVKVGTFRAGNPRVQVYKFGNATASVNINSLTLISF